MAERTSQEAARSALVLSSVHGSLFIALAEGVTARGLPARGAGVDLPSRGSVVFEYNMGGALRVVCVLCLVCLL